MFDAYETHDPQSDPANILARLIQFAYVPEPPPALAPSWQLAFDAVFDVLNGSRDDRFQAFKTATAALPDGYEMYSRVFESTPETEDRAQPHRILYSAEDAVKDPPELQWCVSEILAQPSLTVLVGDPGSKKTYLAMDLAVCVALGKDWLGRTTQPSAALFIDEETGLHQLWARLNATIHAHHADAYTPLHFISLGGYDLRLDKDAEALMHRAISIDARLIIIDSLANLIRGGGENNPASVQPVLFHLRRLAEYCRAAVVVIHHTNRHGVFRGSSSISAAADLMLEVRSAPADTLIEIRTLKARFLAPEPFCARANFATTPDGKPRFHLTPSEEKLQPLSPAPASSLPTAGTQGTALAILEFLSLRQGSTREELSSHLTAYSTGTIRNVLHQLASSGLIKRTDGGKQGKQATYELSNQN